MKEYPFKIRKVEAEKGEDIKVSYKKMNGQSPVEYKLTVESTKKTSGRFFDTIIIRTDSKYRPELKIYVFGNITEELKG